MAKSSLSFSENEHVHQVYEEIASHFSSTRYKPWPVVERFLQELAPGSCGLDIGCGNGKYLNVNKDVSIIASDRSSNLAHIARQSGRCEVMIADGIDIPHPNGRFDFAICIAVIHHFSTTERRRRSVEAILQTLGPNGRCLLFVWALEQKQSRRGWDEQHAQDVLVPWVTKSQKLGEANSETRLRYYHLYKRGELEEDVAAVGGHVVEAGYDRDNWWVVAKRGCTRIINENPIENLALGEDVSI